MAPGSIYCPHCDDSSPCIKDLDRGFTCCGQCGRVIDDDIYDNGPTFYKDPSGGTHAAGVSFDNDCVTSRQRTLMKGKDAIKEIVNSLNVGGGDTIINMAHNFYKLAIDKNFTKGRRVTHVAAACLYVACRHSEKPYLLIDFSDYLQTSVYVLGAVFLQLCEVLLLSDHPFVQKLIDPSLFIDRFTKCLLGERNNKVSKIALRIVANMKRDWIQTGRKPSGICGAALYIAALSCGFDCTKADIVAVVHVCEATLTKRLIEFEKTDSGSIPIEEFAMADTQEPVSKRSPKSGEILCKHKDIGAQHFAHGLCEDCYDEFTILSGGLEGGADPPAFQRAEKQRLEAYQRAEEAETELGESVCDTHNSDVENSTMNPRKNRSDDKSSTRVINKDTILSNDPEEGGLLGENIIADADPESISDIDDEEVNAYLHNEEETQYKKIIWEELNREYLEEQAAKEALAAELAARGVGVEVQKKKRRRNDSSTPAETPAEATYNMLKRKGLASKTNAEAVGRLYNTKDEDVNPNKKEGTDLDDGELDNGETFDHGYDYGDHNYDGYGDGGGGAYNDYDDFDF